VTTLEWPHVPRCDRQATSAGEAGNRKKARDQARLTTAGLCTDVDDLRTMLDILGLWPKDDDDHVQTSELDIEHIPCRRAGYPPRCNPREIMV
jgi:hypothetical protein